MSQTKLWWPFALAVCLSGCVSHRPPAFQADPAQYEVRDTAAWESVLADGSYGVLYRDGMPVAQVDLHFGIHRLNAGAVAYLRMDSVEADLFGTGLEPGSHFVADGVRTIPAVDFLPHFHDYFSAPSVLGGILFYWGLEPLGSAEYRIHAVGYDAAQRNIRSCVLYRGELATDDRGYFTPPTLDSGGIRFQTFGRIFMVSPDFASLEVNSNRQLCRRPVAEAKRLRPLEDENAPLKHAV